MALVGPSGSGKSSCASAMLGLLPTYSSKIGGEALFSRKQGTAVDLLSASSSDLQEIRGREIGMIFQEPMAALNPVLSCGQQLREAIRHLKPSQEDEDTYMRELLAQVELDKLLPRLLTAMPGELSGGQLQRLMLAMALAGQPRLLIADEPTTALDSISEAEIVRLLDRLRQEKNMGLLFITHDESLIRRVTDRTVSLSDRKKENFVAASAGRSPSPKPLSPPVLLLEVRNLSIQFQDAKQEKRVVHNCDFNLSEREWLGLIGPSGCGKSTVAGWLTGLRSATEGWLTVGETTVPASAEPAVVRSTAQAQLIFQDVYGSLNPLLSVGRCVREAVPGYDASTAHNLLASVGLEPDRYAHLRPHQLSGGERQRLAIARALASQPRVLICDEALSGLDRPLRGEVVNVLKLVCEERGIGVILITHDLELARTCAHRLILMEEGNIVERGTVETVLTNPTTELGRRLVATLELRHQ